MKNLLLPIAFVFSFFQASSQTVFLIDSSYRWTWRDSLQQWDNIEKHYYIHDGNGNQLEQIKMLCANGNCVNKSRILLTFNLYNHWLTNTQQEWINNSWTDMKITTYEYDAFQHCTTQVSQNCNGPCINYQLNLDSFDINNDKISTQIQNWNGNAWFPNARFENYFDQYHNQVGYLSQRFDTLTSVWENSYMMVASFGPVNNRVSDSTSHWNGSYFEYNSRDTLLYDANYNNINIFTESYDGSSWQNIHNWLFFYDFNNNCINSHTQNWINSSWNNQTQYLYTYDSDNNRVSQVFNVWDSGWEKTDSVRFYYSQYLLDVKENPAGQILIFPNPATDEINVSVPPEMQSEHYAITDLLGKSLDEGLLPLHGRIDCRDFTPGVYLLQINTGMKLYVKKILVQPDN